METGQILIVIIQILMAIISLIGGAMLLGLRESIKELRSTDEKHAEDMKNYARADELQRWRQEQREESNRMRQEQREEVKAMRDEQTSLFGKVFERLDTIQEKLSNKADRQ
jgi:predicted Holliday junction resolvase-like endonuclease